MDSKMDATLSNPVERPDLSEGMSRSNNADWNLVTQHYLYNRKPEFLAYLYNVSEQEFRVSRPPMVRDALIPGRSDSNAKRVLPTGERYAIVTSFPQPMLIPKSSVDSGEIEPQAIDVRRFLTDLINPDNWGIDQDAAITNSSSGGTNDLGSKGVFWSLNNPPTPAEVSKAIKRMEKRYKKLLEEARAVEVSNPKALSDTLSPEHHSAAEYFHETFSWHAEKIHKEPCPRCGQLAKVGADFHVLEGGGVCVGSWDKAIAAGVRTRSQAYEATENEKYAPRVPVASPTGISTGTQNNSALPSKPPVSEANI